MALPEKLPEPDAGPLLAWLAQHGDDVREAWQALNRLRRVGVRFTVATSKPVAEINLLDAQQNALLALPLVFAQTLADVATYSATANAAYNQAQIQALMDQVAANTNKLNALLAQLRLTGMNPS